MSVRYVVYEKVMFCSEKYYKVKQKWKNPINHGWISKKNELGTQVITIKGLHI